MATPGELSPGGRYLFLLKREFQPNNKILSIYWQIMQFCPQSLDCGHHRGPCLPIFMLCDTKVWYWLKTGIIKWHSFCHLIYKDKCWFANLFFSHLCSVLPAWCRDGCTRRTGRRGSPRGRGPSRRVVSMATSGRGDSSCSDSSSPCGAPCPCPWAGTLPCSVASSGDRHPEHRPVFSSSVSLKVFTVYCCWEHFRVCRTVVHLYLSEAFQVKDEDVRQGP